MNVLVTGGAGFIGSHITEALLQRADVEKVRVLDNFATGSKNNLESFQNHPNFELIEGDIRNLETCRQACENIDLITHQAALGSVPRSLADPITTNEVNVTGTLNIFTAAKEKAVKRIVYAASSSTYGDHPGLPKVEHEIGSPLSPYAVTKYVNELYAQVFANAYNMELIGLRYFNIFGPRQNPAGAYAAVIPLFMQAVKENKQPTINGDGSHGRDFTYVANAVQANMLALFTEEKEAVNQVYNVACGTQMSLLQLYETIAALGNSSLAPHFGPERKGDVKKSLADISKASAKLHYHPSISVADGLEKTWDWFLNHSF